MLLGSPVLPTGRGLAFLCHYVRNDHTQKVNTTPPVTSVQRPDKGSTACRHLGLGRILTGQKLACQVLSSQHRHPTTAPVSLSYKACRAQLLRPRQYD
jgi:hypothetical protein